MRELRRFVRSLPEGRAITAELPTGNPTLADFVHSVIDILERHGRIDHDLYEQYRAKRPARREQLDALEREFGFPAKPMPLPPLQRSRLAARLVRLCYLVGGGVTVGLAWMLLSSSNSSDEEKPASAISSTWTCTAAREGERAQRDSRDKAPTNDECEQIFPDHSPAGRRCETWILHLIGTPTQPDQEPPSLAGNWFQVNAKKHAVSVAFDSVGGGDIHLGTDAPQNPAFEHACAISARYAMDNDIEQLDIQDGCQRLASDGTRRIDPFRLIVSYPDDTTLSLASSSHIEFLIDGPSVSRQEIQCVPPSE